MLRRISSILSLLLFLLAVSAHAQIAQFLAIEGEGTASVLLDKASTQSAGRTAYITDGGKGGQLGLGGARIHGKEILQYLRDEGVTHLVITCSHPHSDHMDGLKKVIRDPKIQNFSKIVFVDNGYDKAGSLFEYYREQWGDNGRTQFSYSSAAKRDAFAELAIPSSAVRVSNFEYDPEEIASSPGETPIHGRSIITQYEVVDDHERAIRVVDLDDASSPLITKWAGQKPPPKLNVLISAHHGSIRNDISPILDHRVEFGLQDVIITANLENQYDHPSPELLLKLVRDLKPEHVFITGSEIGENVEITAAGVQTVESKARHRERLASFIELRIDQHMGISRDLLQRAHARAGDHVKVKAAIAEQPNDRLLETLSKQKLEAIPKPL
jgi:beta-lactamase superfamily II metal-dependent hydrolase